MKIFHFKFISFAILLLLASCNNDDFISSERDNNASISTRGTTALRYPINSFVTTNSLNSTDANTVTSILNVLQGKYGDGYIPVFKRIATTKYVSEIRRGAISGNVPASYNPSTNIVTLKTGTTIQQNYVQEEFIHAAQDRTYSGGILQYVGTTGTPNIEFEAKIIQEMMYYIIDGGGFGNLGAGPIYSDEYIRWIVAICTDGSSDTFPTMTKVLSTKYSSLGYYDFLDYFKIKDSQYNHNTIYSLKPQLIDYINNNYGL